MMCVDKLAFAEVNWIFHAVYENDSNYRLLIHLRENNTQRYGNLLRISELCGYAIVIFSIAGILFNLLVLFVLISRRKDLTCTMSFLLSLSLSDLLIVLVCGPVVSVHAIYGDWMFNVWFDQNISNLICILFHFTLLLSVLVSGSTLSLMTLERFFGVYFPLESKPYRTVKNALLPSLVIWILAILFMTPTIGYSKVRQTPTGCHRCYTGYLFESLTKVSVMVFTLSYLLPLLVISVLNVAVLCKIKKLTYGSSDGQLANSVNSLAKAHLKGHRSKTTLMTLIIVLTYVVCWFPFQSFFLAEICVTYCPRKILKESFPPEYLLIGFTLAFANSCLNPIIYCGLSPSFRKLCKRSFRSNTFCTQIHNAVRGYSS